MPEVALRRHLDVIQKVTGFRPVSCPWRAYSDPLVMEVLSVLWADEHGNLAAAIGPNAPAILVDAIGAMKMAMSLTEAEDRRIREEARKSK